ncbi:MAG: CheR family methyltransferase [Alphaproteobacteria bacterium]
MRLTDFDVYKNLIKEKSGIVLGEDKSYLLESRLTPVATQWGYPTLDAMTIALQGVPEAKLINDIIEAMTTNETSFFRDIRPFDTFKDQVLPYLLENRIHERAFKIWCAAASSGQEPYSLAMILKEHENQFSRWRIDILGTDISNDILDQARKGLYSQFEVQRGLPVKMLLEHFEQIEERWQISEQIKKMVQYRQFNLLDSMATMGTMDVIFCRNVLIYFDTQTKGDILKRMAAQLKDDGFLFMGGAETVLGITDEFAPVADMRGVYAKKGSIHLVKKDSAAQSVGA